MSDRYFVDTNIFIYAHDPSAGVKYEKARALLGRLWNAGAGVLSTQVLQEMCVNLRRKVARPLSTEEVRELVADYSIWEIVSPNAGSILNALEIEVRYRVSFRDALIVQAARSCGATLLYSEDLAHGQVYEGVRVVNPFLD